MIYTTSWHTSKQPAWQISMITPFSACITFDALRQYQNLITDTLEHLESVLDDPANIFDGEGLAVVNGCISICRKLFAKTLSIPPDTQELDFPKRGNAISICTVADQAELFKIKCVSQPPPPVGIYQWTTDKRALAVVDFSLADKQSVRNATEWLATLVEIAVQMYSIPSVLRLNDEEVTEDTLQQCNECGICVNSYRKGMLISRLPCQHTFHRQCVVQWLCNNDTCPLCRQSITITSAM
ncbi:uncharacterized protein BDV17DRAFT_274163 [Aspergillus undulatus]|uniref:uncharacterized protein n=1 Tax=Aspergillus undulatus TaxID=1810928 RepID=UPI003CCDC25B